ncbi:hypothetical protein DVA67_008720 [Solirubrobacter sp. CPCC 204708]|uniref:Uncharacterized protein n=1 Tax=Solirubrobacter deserti TaxID=2282478 RepID=A0ABT4RE52_9ACTN|nr:hypothetical protein [Solirubrobacter deserti]MBE2316056.1 hypothetical protein [Solirubrobacter deserti]MDA0136808.1 hypothetical protein [Solirubrobacter deserti]
MGLAHACRARLELGPANRALAIGALTLNAALVVLVAAEGATAGDLAYVLVLGCPPVVLLALRRHPLAFRSLAGGLGLLYALWSVLAFFIGGIVYAPAAALLLWAALLPWMNPDQRWHRRLWLALAVLSAMLAPIAALSLLSLTS